MIFLIAISVVWFIVFTKKLFFWVYLWQLKEYHVARFRDHFNTSKGKSLIFNYLLLAKILVLISIFISARIGLFEFKLNLVYFVGLLFFVEALFFLKNLWRKNIKRPVITRKTTTILSAGISAQALVLFGLFVLEINITRFVFFLLFLDILAPVIFSVLVLFHQPLAVFLRNRVIKAAKKKRAKFPNLLVIGVTGSYGKTSTKEYLADILSEKFKVLKTKENQNSEVGISECILNELWPGCEIFVCEMGAYNRGGIKFLCDIVQPKIGVLTGINEQHMATFGSQENIVKAKYELIESLPESGMAFFNANNKYCLDLFNKTNIKKKLYGEGAAFSFDENLAAAKAVAQELGLSSEEIARGCQKIKPWPEVKKGVNGINIIDSTYSANPTGVINDLDYLNTKRAKKVIVMPCLIELGKASKEVHQRIGKKIGEVCDLVIITTKDKFKEIKEAASFVGGRIPDNGDATPDKQLNRTEILFIEDPEKIIEKIKSFCQPGDVVLLESRVPSQVIKSLI